MDPNEKTSWHDAVDQTKHAKGGGEEAGEDGGEGGAGGGGGGGDGSSSPPTNALLSTNKHWRKIKLMAIAGKKTRVPPPAWVLQPELERYPHCRYIRGENLGAAGATALAHKIALKVTFGVVRPGCCARAEVLNLSFNRIRPKGCIALSRAIQGGGCPHVFELNFQGNQIGLEGTMALMAAALGGGLQHLKILNLRDNNLEDEAGRQIGLALLKKPTFTRTLVHLDLKNNLLQLPGCLNLINACRGSGVVPRLEVLNLRDNRVSTDGRRRMGRVLPTFLVM